jgi:methanogenic corrinoid protein MtbC1
MAGVTSAQSEAHSFTPMGDLERRADLARPLSPFPGASRSSLDLAGMIESEIIPRLMMAHRRAADPEPEAAGSGDIDLAVLNLFMGMALSAEADAMVALVERLVNAGLTLETVYVDLLIPTARRLGEEWDQDRVSFTDVTIGLGRLQQVVRTLGWKRPPQEPEEEAGAALFVPCPGEQHTFGLMLVEDYFRRAGWRTWLDASASTADAVETVRRGWFDVVGVSATADTEAEMMARTISRIRRASCNPQVFVLVGGRVFSETPELANDVGADAAALSGQDALRIADKAIRRLAFG